VGDHGMKDDDYYTAQVCLNGHAINEVLESVDDSDQRFCDTCGAQTITACQTCGTVIRGRYRHLGFTPAPAYSPPSYCHGCGKPHPWTASSLQAARALADELGELSSDEKELLKGSLDDLVADTPRTALAATRFKRLVAKAGPVVADGFKQILIDVVSESAKKMMWG